MAARPVLAKVFKQGQLTKQGGTKGGWKTWKKRWFVLDNESVSYYKNEEEYLSNCSALGSLDINECNAVISHEQGFLLETNDFTMRVKGNSPEEESEWVKAINEVREANEKLQQKTVSIMKTLSTANIVQDSGLQRSGVLIAEIAEDAAWEERKREQPKGLGVDTKNLKIISEELTNANSVYALFEFGKEAMLINAATVEELLDRLTNVSIVDAQFQSAFLLYHRCFMDSATLFHSLIDIFSIPISKYADRRICTMLRLHIAQLLREWTSQYLDDFNPEMRQSLKEFISKTQRSGNRTEAISEELEAMWRILEKPKRQKERLLSLSQSIVPSELQEAKMYEIPPESIASAMTLEESRMFRDLNALEFVGRGWTKEDAATRCPALIAFVERFNQLSYMISTIILKEESASMRQRLIRHFISVADQCLKLNNFLGAYEVVTGLSLTPVFRLKPDWNALPGRYKNMYSAITEIVNNNDNYINYRKAFRDGMGKPQVPHIAVTLKDVFQLDLLDTKIDDKINWIKYEKQFVQVSMILQCNAFEYKMPAEDAAMMVIHHNMTKAETEDELYNRSFKILPRGSANR